MKYPEVSPFKLLKPYGQEDLSLFFGRAGETRQLAEALMRAKFILLYGASGTGKTSLIQCGLQGMFSPRDWMPLFVRRGNSGFPEAIRQALTEQYEEYYSTLRLGETPPPTDELPLRDLMQALFNLAYVPIYLILDQFEEVFTLGNEAEQATFFETLRTLRLFEEDLFCKILVVVREEYIAHFYRFEKQLPFLFEHRFRIEKMREGQLEQVVRGTLEAEYPGYPLFRAAAGAPLQIVRNLTDERGEVELTTLQVYLDRLYREDLARMDKQTPREHVFFDDALIGTHKLSNVLSDFLDRQTLRVADRINFPGVIKTETGAPSENFALQILFKLVTSQGTKQNRSAAEVQQELEAGRISIDEAFVRQYLDELAGPDSRILSRLRYVKSGEERFEIAHDRLAEVVFAKFNAVEVRQREARTTIENKKKRFDEAAGDLKKQRHEYLSLGELELVGQSLNVGRLGAGLQAFFRESREYHVERRQRERWVAVWLGVAAAVFLGVAVVAGVFYKDAQTARQLADKRRLEAEAERKSAETNLQRVYEARYKDMVKRAEGYLALKSPAFALYEYEAAKKFWRDTLYIDQNIPDTLSRWIEDIRKDQK